MRYAFSYIVTLGIISILSLNLYAKTYSCRLESNWVKENKKTKAVVAYTIDVSHRDKTSKDITAKISNLSVTRKTDGGRDQHLYSKKFLHVVESFDLLIRRNSTGSVSGIELSNNKVKYNANNFCELAGNDTVESGPASFALSTLRDIVFSLPKKIEIGSVLKAHGRNPPKHGVGNYSSDFRSEIFYAAEKRDDFFVYRSVRSKKQLSQRELLLRMSKKKHTADQKNHGAAELPEDSKASVDDVHRSTTSYYVIESSLNFKADENSIASMQKWEQWAYLPPAQSPTVIHSIFTMAPISNAVQND